MPDLSECGRRCVGMVTTALLAGLLLGGCHGPPRAIETAEQRTARLHRERRDCGEFFRTLSLRVGDRMNRRAASGGTLDVLVLSGGGDFGAFGAGFLQGWGTCSEAPMRRPEFDAVFGTSTGALLAPLAFLGTESALQIGADLYADPPSDLVEPNGLLPILPWNESLMKPTGLRRTLEQQLSDAMLDELRAGHAQNRALACASTNVDFGTFRPFDLMEAAAQDNVTFRKAMVERLMASSAIPAAFPPVEIDGSLYVDGGATANIWAVRDQGQPESVLQQWIRRNPGRTPPTVRIWVIINNQLFPDEPNAKREWIDLASRGLSIMLRSTMLKDLRLTAYAAIGVDEKMPGEIEFRFVAIPDEWVPPVKGNFQKPTMQALVELGRKMGADPGSWRTFIPNTDDVGGFDAGKALEPAGRGR